MKADAGRVYGDYLEANKAKRVVGGFDDVSFRDAHRAPSFDNTPIKDRMYNGGDFNLVEISKGQHTVPQDFFDRNVGARYYGYGNGTGIESFNSIRNAMDKLQRGENAKIKMYRAVPKEIKNKKLINKDWVTPSKEYAKNHGMARFGEGEYRIIGQEVPAKDVWWDGNDIREWGYDTGKIQTPKVSDIGINDKLSPFQKQALNKAWNEGAMQLKKGEAIGSMKHIDYMKRNLNTQIADSMKDNPTGIGKIASQDKTVPLQELKSLLKETTNKAVPPEISQQYALAKNVERAYNEGLGFQPNGIKTRNLTFGTQEEKSAFTQGLLEKMMTNESNTNISKEILKNQDVLERVMPERNFKVLIGNARKNDLSYTRLSSLMNAAAKKTGAPEAIGKNTGKFVEWFDNVLSPVGAFFDTLRMIRTANVSGRAAKYLLNPDLPVRVPLYDTIQKYLPSSAVILKESKVKRKENK